MIITDIKSCREHVVRNLSSFSDCMSVKYCDFGVCGTCVKGGFNSCNSNNECYSIASNDTRPTSCTYSDNTNDMRCLPSCPKRLDNTIIEDPDADTTSGMLQED